ncbi:MAG: hypothetical protein J6M21_05820 [Campylobacter sp.]|nr:hypothetical protein [Campylobacter sp.]
MKKFVIFMAVICIFLVVVARKKDEQKRLSCNNPVVLQELKNAIVKEFKPLCDKSEEWVEYCNAETGEFFVNQIDFYGGKCAVPFEIPDDIPGWIVGYKVEYENKKPVVSLIDYMAY